MCHKLEREHFFTKHEVEKELQADVKGLKVIKTEERASLKAQQFKSKIYIIKIGKGEERMNRQKYSGNDDVVF